MSERLVEPSTAPGRVVVAGGGPAGLKAAEVAARRGHEVILLEKSKRLGGQVRLAALQPEHSSIGEVTSYLEAAVADLKVDVRLRTEATAEAIVGLKPDTVIVAIGSEPNLPRTPDEAVTRSRELGRQVLPEIEGLDQPFVVSSDEVLSGATKPSGHVVVVDNNGHWEAAGTAEYLADAGCRVTVIASHALVGENIEAGARTLFHRRAAIKGMTLRPATQLVAVEKGRVRVAAVFSDADAIGWARYILMPGEDEIIDGVDWVVPVIGRRSREDLYLELKKSPAFAGVRVERVGDCAVPRLIQSTIAEAFELARRI